MPKVKRTQLPSSILAHLIERVEQRQVTTAHLASLASWLDMNPTVPSGDWYKDFGAFVLCGKGEFPKTVLSRGMRPFGEKVD